MKIKIINPNTTQSMTESIENLARRVARSDTQVWAVTPASGPDSIECYVDEYLAVPGVLKEVIRGDREEGADAFIIACFGDPGLQAAREVTSKPVLGICESAVAAAKFIAPYFSIVSVLDRSRKVTEDVVSNYGAEKFCRSIRSTGLSVLEFQAVDDVPHRRDHSQRRRAVGTLILPDHRHIDDAVDAGDQRAAERRRQVFEVKRFDISTQKVHCRFLLLLTKKAG